MFEAFSREELEQLRSPCVYVFIRDAEPVYVGSSEHGIVRWGSESHHIKDFDDVFVFSVKDPRMAEHVTLSWLRPLLNRWTPAQPIKMDTGNAELEEFISTHAVATHVHQQLSK